MRKKRDIVISRLFKKLIDIISFTSIDGTFTTIIGTGFLLAKMGNL
jgi:hypothetical protein